MAAHQPNYLPWLGFFDKMRKCDIFVIQDISQFSRQNFQNRNRIKTSHGVLWLTVPISRETLFYPISDVKIARETAWAKKHWLTIKYNYARALYWHKYCDFFRQTYSQTWTKLIDLNMHLIRGIMTFLNINKKIVFASSLDVSGKKSDLLLAQCMELGADTYLSGVGGHNYLELQLFKEKGIKVSFQDFQYPVYPQLWGEFIPNLSVVDYLFCAGSAMFENRRHRRQL